MSILNEKRVEGKVRGRIISEISELKSSIEESLGNISSEDLKLFNTYFNISREAYDYRESKNNKDTWVDYIEIYKGIFSLYKPTIRIRWAEIKRGESLSNDSFEKQYLSSHSNELFRMNSESLFSLKKDLESLLRNFYTYSK